MKIFISYRREDSAGHTGHLYDSLRAHFGKGSLFMDLSAIVPGQNFAKVIRTEGASCDALIAVIGNRWLTCTDGHGRRLDDPSDFVRREIFAALDRGIPVFPVLIEGASMPQPEALPDALKPMVENQWHELSDSRWDYDVEHLIQAVDMLAGKQRRWKRLLPLKYSLPMLRAVLALVGALVFFWLQPISPDKKLDTDDAAQTTRAVPDATPIPLDKRMDTNDADGQGIEYLEIGKYELAIAQFDKAIARTPTAESYYHRGLAYYERRKYDDAVADWTQAINLKPNYARAYRQRANAYSYKGDSGPAEADYNRSIELEPRVAIAYLNRGMLYKQRLDREKAIADFRRVLKLSNDPKAVESAREQLAALGSK